MKIRVTEDKILEETVRAALKENDGYCPCKITHIKENKCMCKEFIEQPFSGECHCGLYIKE